MMLNSQLPPILSAIPSAIFFISRLASLRHSSFSVLKVPSSFTSLGIILVAPLAITFPNERTEGKRGSAFLLTICCKATMICEVINTGSIF
ncbi:hypothetical protein D3C78_1387020 [compost metagenome]